MSAAVTPLSPHVSPCHTSSSPPTKAKTRTHNPNLKQTLCLPISCFCFFPNFYFRTVVGCGCPSAPQDFRILFDANGMLTWFRHIGSIRSLTFITPETGFFHDIYDQLRKSARLARLRAGAPIPGTDRVVPPIHVIREDYFWKRYRDFYGCPYAKVRAVRGL